MDRVRQGGKQRNLSSREELFNSITHGVGVMLSIVALVVLIVHAVTKGNAWHVVSFSIFGSTLILMYLSSALYHGSVSQRWKNVFIRFDHSVIFLLIAGTYTPYLLTVVKGGLGWVLFGIIRLLAIIGVVIRSIAPMRFVQSMLIVYLMMGWMFIIAIVPMIKNMPSISFILLLVGGVLYSIGTIFYNRRLMRFSHGIRHLFVLAGSTAHFFSILYTLR